MSQKPKSPLGLIFLTIFIDMVGFGIVLPILPLSVEEGRFGASPLAMGLLMGIYSLLQLVFAPVFGKISDRVGRKPVLVVSILGTAAGFAILGAAQTLAMLFLGRIIDGISGGNIATAQACIADVTPPDQRSKSMALIGAAFGLGFVFGPAMGGVLSERYGFSTPFYVAAGLALLNAVLVMRFLPETHSKENRADERATLGEVFRAEHGTMIGLILLAYLTSITGFSIMTALFAVFCKKHFGLAKDDIGYLLAYIGVLGIFIQGGLVRRLMRRPIEKQLALIGAAVLSLSLFLLPMAGSVPRVMWVCVGLALGNGFITPMLNGLVSRHTSARAQGRVLGLMQSSGSLGRFAGFSMAFWLLEFESVDAHYGRVPFWVGAGLLVVTFFLVAMVSPQRKAEPSASPVPQS